MPTTFAVLGSGGWGTAVAVHLTHATNHRVRLWGAHPETVRQLRSDRENTRLLPGIRIPDSVEITADAVAAVAGADCWVSAIPTAFLRVTLARFTNAPPGETPVVSLSKGLEVGTFLRPTKIIAEVLGADRVVVLSGPSHAEEVARRLPASLVAASEDLGLAAWTQAQFGTDRFRVYTNADVVGVELAGALKNVIAVAAGVCDGLGFGDNAKAALLARGLVEMTRLGVALGAEAATFSGLAGVGDLIATCFSEHGRNRRVGFRLGRGDPLDEVLAGPQIAEGVTTSRSVHERIVRMGIEAPIMTAVYRMLHEGRPPLELVQELMTRRQKEER